jgi:hypothetical protein
MLRWLSSVRKHGSLRVHDNKWALPDANNLTRFWEDCRRSQGPLSELGVPVSSQQKIGPSQIILSRLNTCIQGVDLAFRLVANCLVP